MAVMASETPVDAISFSEKAQPLSDSALNPAPAQVNGDTNHHDKPLDELLDEPVVQNGTNLATPDAQPTMSHEESIPSKTLAAEDATAAPIEHVAPGITPLASFLPETSEPVPSAAEPPATSTEPPAVEATLSSVRDEPLPEPQASAAIPELVAEPTSTSAPAPAPSTSLPNPPTPTEDKMDVSEDVSAPVAPAVDGDDVPMGDAIDDSSLPVQPAVSDVVTTLPGDSVPTPPPAAQETVVTGQVRQREEDEDDEPAAKRAKTESEEEENLISSSDVPVPSTEVVQSTPNAVAPAPATSAAPSLAAPLPPLQALPLDSSPLTKIQHKYLVEQIRKAKKTKSAVAFLQPVDPIALNIPTYIDIIKLPMDLSTMEAKLKSEQYATADDLMSDFITMVQNSLTFNGPNHPVSVAAMNLKAYWDKCMSGMPKGAAAQAAVKPPKAETAIPKVARPARTSTVPVVAPTPAPPPPPPTAKSPTEPAGFLDEHGNPMIRRTSTAQTDRPKREIIPPKRDLPYSGVRPKKKKAQLELKFCEVVLNEISKKKYAAFSFPFMSPVDPVALNIPHYHRIVKKPMDFGTISTKLKGGEYANAKEFHADAKLVFINCYKFNPAGDEVHKMGRLFESTFDAEWDNKDAWLASNQPPSEPPSEDEEEEEEEEEPVEDLGLKRMEEIRAQIAALSAEAMQLTQATAKQPSPKVTTKKSAKSGSSKKAAAPKATTISTPKVSKPKAKKPPKKLTMDQKREVSDGIAVLDEAKMRKAVNIIRAGVPHLASVQDDELELDIDEIPDDVVYKLWEFVRSNLPKKTREPSPEYDDEGDDEYVSASKPTAHRKKNKPMKAKEQEERIAQLKEKLSGGGASGSSASPAANHDSDDEASEESEEE